MNPILAAIQHGRSLLNNYQFAVMAVVISAYLAVQLYALNLVNMSDLSMFALVSATLAFVCLTQMPFRQITRTTAKINLSSLPRWITFGSYVVAILFALIDPAFAGGFDKVTENATNIQTLLKGIAIVVVTIAIMIAGYKIAFSGARLQDVAGILIGGTLIGGASALAAWIATPDG